MGCASGTPLSDSRTAPATALCAGPTFWGAEQFPGVRTLIGQLIVVNKGGQDFPLPDANVVTVGPDGTKRKFRTDGNGRFKVNDLKPGRYRILVCKFGYTGVDGWIEIDPRIQEDAVTTIRVDLDA